MRVMSGFVWDPRRAEGILIEGGVDLCEGLWRAEGGVYDVGAESQGRYWYKDVLGWENPRRCAYSEDDDACMVN